MSHLKIQSFFHSLAATTKSGPSIIHSVVYTDHTGGFLAGAGQRAKALIIKISLKNKL